MLLLAIPFQLGGPFWNVLLGRLDATTASQSTANSDLPGPSSDLSTLISKFAAKGLTARDMTALSGAHTIGQARCATFRTRIYNDTDVDPNFAALRKPNCPASGGDDNLAPLDVQSPNRFGSEPAGAAWSTALGPGALQWGVAGSIGEAI